MVWAPCGPAFRVPPRLFRQFLDGVLRSSQARCSDKFAPRSRKVAEKTFISPKFIADSLPPIIVRHEKARNTERRAKADPEIALSLAGTTSPFTIEVRFLGGLTQPQMDAFKGAADRWSRMIVGDLPDIVVDGQRIDDVLILARGADIDGPGRILGQAGATHVRPANAGDSAFIPARGRMTFDTADLEQLEQRGTLNDVITHEMGHVIGVSGLIWGFKGLLNGAGTENPTFEGRSAMEEYGRLRGDGSEPTPVPVENEGGPGTAGSHWREKVFRNELMSGFIAAAGNPISRMTV